MIIVGDHRFTVTDAHRTLSHAFDLLDLYPPAAVELQTRRRQRIRAVLDGADPSDEAALASALTDVWPQLLAARDELLAAGLAPRSATGRVEQLNVSGGGVPKLPVDRAEVGFGGMSGDRQRTRLHHGRPWQALCLWSREVIAELAAEGHSLGPGRAGENITLSGLDWRDVRPGVRLQIGSVLCQISAFAIPCKQNARWFTDGDFSRIHYSRGPISRVYATVLAPGDVATGDPAVLEPA